MGKKSSCRKKGQSTTHAHPPILREDPLVVREDPHDPPTIHGANANSPEPQIASSSLPSQVPSGHCILREGSYTNTPILPHQVSSLAVDPQQANSSQINESPVQCRILIEPHGDQFLGDRTSATISTIMERHFNGPWKSFREVPIEFKNLWFEEFEKRFRWLPEHDALVRINWAKVCQLRLRGKLAIERTKSTAPEWIDAGHWAVMREYYDSPDYKKKSDIAKRNRAKLVGPSHTGGSISFSEHVKRARRAKGDSFDFLELHDDLHTIKYGHNKGEFVSEKAKKILEKVHSLKADLESSGNSVTQQKDIKELFVEANNELFGERKKGRICGLGSEAAILLRPPTSSSISSSISHALELAEMQKKMDEMTENEKTLRKKVDVMTENEEKMKTTISRMDFLMRNLYSQMGIPVPRVDDGVDEDVGFSPVDHHPSFPSGSNPPPPPPPSAAAPTHYFG